MKLKERRQEIVQMTDDQLQEELRKLREELFRLRFQYANRQQKNYQLYTVAKKDVARVLTEMRAREIGLAVAPAPLITRDQSITQA